jgi:hypothetical protein
VRHAVTTAEIDPARSRWQTPPGFETFAKTYLHDAAFWADRRATIERAAAAAAGPATS